MTSVGDDAPEASAQPGGPAAAGAGSGAQAPTQAMARPGFGPAPGQPDLEETGRTLPVPPGGPQVPSEAERAQAERAQAEAAKAERARAKAAQRAARRSRARRPKQTRRAKLRLTRVDPWSVTKTAFLLSIAFGIMCVVAVFLVFSIMNAAGLWDKVNSTIQQVVNQSPQDAFNIKDYVAMNRVMGITMLIAVIDVVLITALATLGAFIYNMSAAMLGGVEVTLAEDLD